MLLAAAALLCAAMTAAAPANVTDEVTDDVTRQQQIAALEQVKVALYEQLRAAVQETVASVNGTDAAALTALLPLADLRALLADEQRDTPARRRFEQLIGRQDAPNAADAPPVDMETTLPPGESTPAPPPAPTGGLAPLVHTTPQTQAEKDRRAQGSNNAKYWYTYFNLGDVLNLQFDKQGFVVNKGKTVTEEKQAQLNKNKEEIMKRLNAWYLQKEEEKNKIKENRKLQRGKFEKCPRWGKKKKKVFPCCRKCCKSSYLGCL